MVWDYSPQCVATKYCRMLLLSPGAASTTAPPIARHIAPIAPCSHPAQRYPREYRRAVNRGGSEIRDRTIPPEMRAYRKNSHGASHLTAIRNPLTAAGWSTRKTSPATTSGRALGKQRVTSIFERIGISVSLRSRRPWALTFCATASTSPLSPAWNFTKLPNRVSTLAPALLSGHGSVSGNGSTCATTASVSWLSASPRGCAPGGFSQFY